MKLIIIIGNYSTERIESYRLGHSFEIKEFARTNIIEGRHTKSNKRNLSSSSFRRTWIWSKEAEMIFHKHFHNRDSVISLICSMCMCSTNAEDKSILFVWWDPSFNRLQLIHHREKSNLFPPFFPNYF